MWLAQFMLFNFIGGAGLAIISVLYEDRDNWDPIRAIGEAIT